ncbi:hypothetical protein M408DRAFT_220000 [Serendipita vermifera MAFF 305830]|uniref:RING-type domain-containing protein n=1 Tax=Serendipita vermifera MAFF 305830 TaxID=933852 RepID=A0A0C2X2L5_SERVB|nr:hypothetical protein M408DRAFT_220000 [Serendipita vermifera MAFF 305830]
MRHTYQEFCSFYISIIGSRVYCGLGCGNLLLSWLPPLSFGSLLVSHHREILELLMATTAENRPENARIGPEILASPSSASAPVIPAATAVTASVATHPRQLDHSWHPWQTLIGVMGYGRRGTLRNKHIFTLCFKLVLSIAQIVAIGVLCAISVQTASSTNPDISEWDACDRPLGPWVIVWAVRVALGMAISIYSFILVRPGLVEFIFDPENNINTDAVQTSQTPPPVGPLNGPGQPQFIHSGRVHPIPRPLQTLTTMLSLLSIIWFIASHVLVYTSLNTCRRTSPHLWYLAFSIMSIAYVLIAEVLAVIFFLFFVVPMLLMIVNLLLLCMGRQPLFRPNGINHEIGKLPQQLVDRIPLVMYIPTPPPKDTKDVSKEPSHTYPPPTSDSEPAPETAKPTEPAPAASPAPVKKHRFAFFRRSKKSKNASGDLEAGKGGDGKSKGKQKGGIEDEWEANWERGQYPFVKLPDNRATCAICLLDFEEPPRRGSANPSAAASAASAASAADLSKATKVQVEPSASALALQDAGEGATPLRLLACGHAFHQVCLDPWLKDVSGRCPVCQRKVDIEELEKLSKNGSSTAWATNAITPAASPAAVSPPATSPLAVSPPATASPSAEAPPPHADPSNLA